MDKPISRPQDVARRLREVRLKHGLSEEDFSHHLAVSHAQYLAYEGSGDIPSAVLARLFERFCIDPMWLVLGYKRDTISSHALAASIAYREIPDAAESQCDIKSRRVRLCDLGCDTFHLEWSEPEPSHADVPVKLATINSGKI